jgi:hypothetical protein
VPRPSSPLGAKASTRCPSLSTLDPGGTEVPPSIRPAAHRGNRPRDASDKTASLMKTLLPLDQASGRQRDGPETCVQVTHNFSLHHVKERGPEARKALQASLRSRSETGGGERDRTDDLLLAKQALSQLSYTPGPEVRDQGSGIGTRLMPDPRSLTPELVGQGGLEPPTSRLSSARSNQLSY